MNLSIDHSRLIFLIPAVAALAGPQALVGQVAKEPQPRPTPPVSGPAATDLQAAVTAFVKGDNASASRLWRSLADRGNAFARTWFADMIAYTSGEESKKRYVAAGNQGDTFAMKRLVNSILPSGEAESDKWNVTLKTAKMNPTAKQEYAIAAGLFLKAAESNGNPVAQRTVGNLYSQGRGFQEDATKALQWWRMAADRGDPESMDDLGDAYRLGSGTKQNLAEAESWFRKAYAAGYAIGTSPTFACAVKRRWSTAGG